MADKGQTIVRIKVLLIGPSNSGKTTFLKAITSNDALNVYTPTNGTAFYNHTSKMLSPAAELFIHFVDTSEAAVSSKEYLGALMNRTNFCIVFFECFNKESVAKAQNMILTIRELASTNNLPVPADIFAIGSKKDVKLSTDLNSNEILVKNFKDNFRVTPSLLDCRNRMEMKNFFQDCIDNHVRRLHPSLPIPKRDPKDGKMEEDRIAENEPKIVAKKDDGCILI